MATVYSDHTGQIHTPDLALTADETWHRSNEQMAVMGDQRGRAAHNRATYGYDPSEYQDAPEVVDPGAGTPSHAIDPGTREAAALAIAEGHLAARSGRTVATSSEAIRSQAVAKAAANPALIGGGWAGKTHADGTPVTYVGSGEHEVDASNLQAVGEDGIIYRDSGYGRYLFEQATAARRQFGLG